MKKIIKYTAIGLFVVLLALNITTTINSTTDAHVALSLSGLKAMAQTGGEGGEDGGGTCEDDICDSVVTAEGDTTTVCKGTTGSNTDCNAGDTGESCILTFCN